MDNAVAGTELVWYDDNGKLANGTEPTWNEVGTKKYYVVSKLSNDTCESPQTEKVTITLTINDSDAPTIDDSNKTKTFCTNDKKRVSDLTALLIGNNVNVEWKVQKTGETAKTVANEGDLLVSGTYYATQQPTDACRSSKALEIVVTINANPTLPTITKATPTNADCNGTGTATIEGGLVAGLTYTLSELDANGAVVGTPKTLTSATITGLKFNTDYKVTITNNSNCSVETTGDDIINIRERRRTNNR